MRTRFAFCLPVVCLALCLLVGCGSSSSSGHTDSASVPAIAPAGNDGGGYDASTEGMEEEVLGGPSLSAPQDGRQVILNATLNIEALDFEATCASIETAAEAAGGYIASAQVNADSYSYSGYEDYYGSYGAYFSVRVPAENYGSFLSQVGDAGHVSSRNEYSEDITSAYVDLEARLTALRTQEARLLELMEEAGDLADLITIQDQLTEVQYEIESYMAQKNSYDDLVAYSTVDIYVYEVVEYTEPAPESYGERIQRAFAESWRTFATFWRELSIVLVYALPLLLVLAVIAAVVIFLSLRGRKKRKSQAAAQPSAPVQSPGYDWNATYAYYGYPVYPDACAYGGANPCPPTGAETQSADGDTEACGHSAPAENDGPPEAPTQP